jgi:hypothetical protein
MMRFATQKRGCQFPDKLTSRWKWIPELFSRRQDIQLIASALSIHLIISLVYLSSAFAGTSGVFTTEPFNGLQIVYSIEGAELGAPVDGGPFCCWDREYTGTFTAGSTLSASGTGNFYRDSSFVASDCYHGDLYVEVHAGNESKEYHYRQPNGATGGVSQPYNVQIQIPAGATTGGFSIEMTYVNCYYGDRAVRIYGTLSAAIGPTLKPQSKGSSEDNPNTTFIKPG